MQRGLLLRGANPPARFRYVLMAVTGRRAFDGLSSLYSRKCQQSWSPSRRYLEMKMLRFAIVVAALLPWATTSAQEAKKDGRLSVYVAQSGEDAVGQALAYAVREELRRSAGFNATTAREALVTINIASLDLGSERIRAGTWSAIAVSYTMYNLGTFSEGNPQTLYPIYLSGTVIVVGADATDRMAKSVVAMLDRTIEAFNAAGKK